MNYKETGGERKGSVTENCDGDKNKTKPKGGNGAIATRGAPLKTGKAGPLKNLYNVKAFLASTPDFAGALAYDQLRQQAVLVRRTPAGPARPVDDHVILKIAEYIQAHDLNIPVSIIRDGIIATASEHSFHPVQRYLQGLKWDGEERIDTWLTTYCGTHENEYTRHVGAKWMISATARAMSPGCQADAMMVLEGKQGQKKSSAVNVLGGEWFSDSLSAFDSKDSKQEATRWWIIEVAELNAMNKSEVSAIKSFLTRRVERFRLPYGQVVGDVPRSCVFAGTVNPIDGYLRDPTGGRRFWPVEIGKRIDVDQLEKDRDQLWAEAKARFDAGEEWWLNDEIEGLAVEEQDARREVDSWESKITEYIRLYEGGELTMEGILGGQQMLDGTVIGLGLEVARWGRSEQIRVGMIMSSLGYRRERIGHRSGRSYIYKKDEK